MKRLIPSTNGSVSNPINISNNNTSINNTSISNNNNDDDNNNNNNNNESRTIILDEYKRQPWKRRKRIIVFFLIHIITFIITYRYYQIDVNSIIFGISGGSLGFASCLFVLTIFHLYPEELTPPLELLYWRTWCDLLIGLRFMMSNIFIYQNPSDCGPASGLLEFAEISSEMWYVCVTVDLAYSFMNPFSSFKTRLKYYHLFVWSIALLFSLPVGLTSNIHDLFILGNDSVPNVNQWGEGFCWVTAKISNVYPWIFLYLPLLLCFFVSLIICIIAYQRFKSGVALTLLHRLNILTLNFVNITCGIIYWFVLGTLAASTASSNALKLLNPLIIYIIATKGSISIVVWILITDVRRLFKNSDDDNIDLNDAMKEEILLFAVTGLQNTCQGEPNQISHDGNIKKIITSNTTDSNIFAEKRWFIINIMLGDEELITRILNQAKEAQSAKLYNENERPSATHVSFDELQRRGSLRIKKPAKTKEGRDVEMVSSGQKFNESPVYVADLVRSGEETLYERILLRINRLFGEFQHATFYEYEYQYFRRIRKACKILPEEYAEAFEKKLKARLTQGGASGALFFFSHCETFVAKSCTQIERNVILANAKSYCEYLEKNENTYITKIFGVYRLKIYGVKMNFIVMNNIFQVAPTKGITFSEKYDIKGSWVARNASPPTDGQKMICMHCQKTFYFKKVVKARKAKTNRILDSDASPNSRINSRATSQTSESSNTLALPGVVQVFDDDRDVCSYTVKGFHEPILVMKDNDLKHKLNLTPHVARLLFKQLKKDADFLCDVLNVMDYSLLIGVQRSDYYIQDSIAVSRTSSGSDSNKSRNTYISDASSPAEHGGLEVYKFTAPKSYKIGIIDFCQKWTIEKRFERFYKVYFLNKDKEGVSAIEPNSYRARFINHVAEILNVNDDGEDSDHVLV